MRAQRMPVLRQDARIIFVLFFFAVRVRRGCSRSHRRVDTHGQNRDRLVVFQFANQVDDFLRAADSERGNQHRRVALRGVVDDSRERDLWIFRIVQAVAVG
jgi:hypothetical protein